MSSKTLLTLGCFIMILLQNVESIDYGTALTKSLMYFEAQRSGKLPPNQHVQWRGDSALNDGQNIVDLVGGYYDAGDNVKFGFPMAFTVTMLAWSVVEFGQKLEEKNELLNALDAIKWGTDYFIKAHHEPNVLYGEVGDGNSDHVCWQRPEDMTTPRTCYKIDKQNPGADLAAETAAALAAAAIVFNGSNPSYSSLLLTHAKQLFDFAANHHGLYQTSIPDAGQFYSSSGFEDELLWAAAWLHRATNEQPYIDYINQAENLGGTRSMFSWDDKYVGTQILITKSLLKGNFREYKNFANFKSYAEQYICNCIQSGSSNVRKTRAGLLWWQPWNNLQYVTSALFVIANHADTLIATNDNLQCQGGSISPEDLFTFTRSQVDYILGLNPKGLSYMVGFGSNYPTKVHHRGASIVSIKKDPKRVTCQGGFEWFTKDTPNPNILDGAVVGGPDLADDYADSRSNYMQAEATTANTAPLVGVLARLA